MTALRKPALFPLVAGVLAVSASGLAQAGGTERARVISSRPIIEHVSTPREVCQDQVVQVPGRSSGAGALMGGIAGGAMGNAIGGGSGRALATVIGVVGGAVIGDRIEGRGQTSTQTVRQCSTQQVQTPQTVGYNVVYEYAGRQYTTQTPQQPGRFIRVDVAPSQHQPAWRPQAQHSQPNYQPQVIQPVVAQVAYPAPQVVHVDASRGHRDRYEHGHRGHDNGRWDREWR